MDPKGTVGRISKEDHYTLLQTKYESSGPCGFGEEDFFLCFSHDAGLLVAHLKNIGFYTGSF